jgi:two-component system, OmpR family, sensor kinase
VARAFRLRGLRSRLVAAIMIVAAGVLVGSFLVLHRVSDAQLREEIDSHLRADLGEFETSAASSARRPAQLRRRSEAFVRSQSYHPDSRIFVISVDGHGVVSNQRTLVSRELGEAEEEPDELRGVIGLLDVPRGLSTVGSDDDQVRVLSEPIRAGGRALGTFRVGESLEQVEVAQGSLGDTLIVVAALALLVLLVAAIWIATLAAKPLQRIASFAAGIDTRELDRRLAIEHGADEIVSLADSFNRMLDRLQRSFEREREFVADASHELRTPVTIAHGELELLRRDLDAGERDRLDKVRRELMRMERLVSEMLSLASAEDSATALRRERIDIADMLADLRRDLPLLGSRDYRVSDLGGSVDGDPDRLAQVFRNLAANAVAHTRGGAMIEVGAEAEAGRIRFTVADDGPGVSESETAHLFDRFYRSSQGSQRDRAGSGLGLAIARAIVEAHGGTIEARPSRSGGLEIVFDLPGYLP